MCGLVGLVIALVTGANSTSAAAKWIRLEGPDFVVMSDASERSVVDFARDYAAYRMAAQHFFARPGTAAPRSILMLFSRHRDFSTYTRELDEKSHLQLFSFSTEVDGRAVTALSRGDDWDQTMRLTREFETIWVMRSYGWALPTWMAQGCGSVLSSIEIGRDNTVVVGNSTSHVGAWSTAWMLPWERFFEISRGSPEYTGETKSGVFHSQAWGLMHWLLLRDVHGAARFADLARRLSNDLPADAVTTVGGVKLEELTGAVRRHVQHGRLPTLRIPFDAAAVESSFTVGPLPEFERLAMLSDLAAAAGKVNDADLLYFKARALAPNEPVVLEAGARWSLRRGEQEAAIDRYREAMAAGSTNAQAYLASARWRLDRSAGGADRAGGGIPVVLEPARAEILRALELDAGQGEAFRLLGRLAYLEPEPDAAWLETLTRRIGPDFWGTQVRLYRGLLLGRLGRIDEAVADFKVLLTQSEASEALKENAERHLVQLRMAEVRADMEKAVNAGQFTEGLALLDRWAAEAKPAEVELRELGRLRQQIVAARAKADQRTFERVFRELNGLIKVRHWDAAIARAAALVADATASPDLHRAFVKLADQVDGVATLQLLRADLKAGRKAEAIRRAEAYLARAPAEEKSRAAIEARLAEARGDGPTQATEAADDATDAEGAAPIGDDSA